jgi:LAO/AO transport system kinase
MLELRRVVHRDQDHDAAHRPAGGEVPSPADLRWEPPVVSTVAVRDEGTEELATAIARHRAHLESSPEGRARAVRQARAAFVGRLRERLLAGALARLEQEEGQLDEVAERIATRRADPYRLVDELAERLGMATGDGR